MVERKDADEIEHENYLDLSMHVARSRKMFEGGTPD
jgi:hypothetical protein